MFPRLLIDMAKARQEEPRRKAERERLSRADRSRALRARTRLRVVIVGGGFGGLACARALDGVPVDVLLIDRENYHLFTPLLYQVATALLNPSDIAYPIRKVFRRSLNVRFRQATVTEVDFGAKVVRLHEGAEVAYDRLVLATGSTNNYFGNPALAHLTIGMKQLREAIRLRNHVLSCLEMATQTTDPHERRAWLTFLVVGGGPTGVEYAGALGELLRLVVGRDYPELSLEACRIVLVEGMDRLLSQFPKRLGEYARRALARRGVDVLVSSTLESAEAGLVRLSSGEMISCRTVVWSAGVRSTDPIEGATLRRTPTGRLRVDEHLRVADVRGVFAIGDAASVPWRKGELPMLSPPAMQEGRHVARLIRDEAVGRSRGRRPFRYLNRGAMATIGRSSAVAQIGPLRLWGFPGWVAWLVVHIWYLVGFRNRLAVLSSWSWNYVRKDRVIRIVVESDADPVADAVHAHAPERGYGTPPRREDHQKRWQRLSSLSIGGEAPLNETADPVGRWPEHLPVGAVRVSRASAQYDQTVQFYRDLVGLPVLESFEGSYGEDGTIFGLPDASLHLEIVRSTEPAPPVDRIDMLVFYLADSAAREPLVARMAAAGLEPASQHPYWQANGGASYRDPDGREVVFVSWTYGAHRT